jgi:hypothetical protein
MTGVFPGLDSSRFAAAHEGLNADLRRLAALYDRHGVRGGPHVVRTRIDDFEQLATPTNPVPA